MTAPLDLETVWNFATALLIGAAVGVERERHKRAEGDVTSAGLRTFILFALLGAIGGWLTQLLGFPWILVAVIVATMVLMLAGYVLAVRAEPDALGLTTELAAVAVCLLGATTMLGHRPLAVALGITVAAVLAYKQPLHGLVDRLDRDDVYAGLRLAIATFIILPLLPDRAIDPWGALNPSQLWLLVLLISGLSLIGYIATRLLGTHHGIPLTGLTGGLVSSTAVTLSFARQSREKVYAQAAPSLASGILLAWAVMFVRVIIEVAVVNRSLLVPVLVRIALLAVVAAAFAWAFHRRATVRREAGGVPLENPFSLTAAAKFAALFAAVMLLVKLVENYAPGSGLYFVAALAGTTDVDAITLSMAEFGRHGDPVLAVNTILIAAISNTIVKAGMVATLGTAELRRPVLVASAAIVIAGVAVLVLL